MSAIDEMLAISDQLFDNEVAARASSLSPIEARLRVQNEELTLRLQAEEARCERLASLLQRARHMLSLHTINLDGLTAEIDAELSTAIQPAPMQDQNQATAAASTPSLLQGQP